MVPETLLGILVPTSRELMVVRSRHRALPNWGVLTRPLSRWRDKAGIVYLPSPPPLFNRSCLFFGRRTSGTLERGDPEARVGRPRLGRGLSLRFAGARAQWRECETRVHDSGFLGAGREAVSQPGGMELLFKVWVPRSPSAREVTASFCRVRQLCTETPPPNPTPNPASLTPGSARPPCCQEPGVRPPPPGRGAQGSWALALRWARQAGPRFPRPEAGCSAQGKQRPLPSPRLELNSEPRPVLTLARPGLCGATAAAASPRSDAPCSQPGQPGGRSGRGPGRSRAAPYPTGSGLLLPKTSALIVLGMSKVEKGSREQARGWRIGAL